MARLLLSSDLDILNLNEQAETGFGFQATSGLLGLGLPPVSVQWLEGAGDGAKYRGQRVLPRDIDVPLDILGRDRDHLKELVARLAKVLAVDSSLVFIEDTGEAWMTKVRRVGGGEYTYGLDTTGERDLSLVITLRAGDPYFTASESVYANVNNGVVTGGFVDSMISMQVSASQAVGDIILDNPGDARAYPVWTVTGPGTDFKVTAPNGEVLRWVGTLSAGETLTFNTKTGTVTDQTGASRYSSLAAAPRFFSIAPGRTTVAVEFLDIDANSKVICSFQPRRWVVI